jgi:hypothetical protein
MNRSIGWWVERIQYKSQLGTLILGIILTALLLMCSSNGSNSTTGSDGTIGTKGTDTSGETDTSLGTDTSDGSDTLGFIVTGLAAIDPISAADVTVSVPVDEEDPQEVILGSGLTDLNGKYSITVTEPPPYRITTAGGTMREQPFSSVLTAFCTTGDNCNASPYTSAHDSLVVVDGKNAAEATFILNLYMGVTSDPFLYEIETGGPDLESVFDLTAAKDVLTTKEAVDTWIADLAAGAAGVPDAPVPAGVTPPVQATDPYPILKHPYLMLTGKNTEMKILWQIKDDLAISKVDLTWKAASDATWETVSPSSVENQAFLYQHTLTGLTAATLYDYKVNITQQDQTEAKSYSGSFTTPPADDADSVSFYSYGDTRSNPLTHNNVVGGISKDMEDMKDSRQTFVLHVGDFVWCGYNEYYWQTQYFVKGSEYESTQKFLSTFPIAAAIGNHEFKSGKGDTANCGQTNNAEIFRKYWPSDLYHPDNSTNKINYYYSFDYGPVHFAVIDTYTTAYEKDSEQYTWLENDLMSTEKKWKVVATHVPFYNADGSNSDAACDIPDIGKNLHDGMEGLLQTYGVQLVLQGHQHYYSRATINNISYFVVGGGGATVTGGSLDQLPPYSLVPKTADPSDTEMAEIPDSVPEGNFNQIYHFARVDVSPSEMKVSIIKVENAEPNQNQPSNSLYEEVTIAPDGTATVNWGN